LPCARPRQHFGAQCFKPRTEVGRAGAETRAGERLVLPGPSTVSVFVALIAFERIAIGNQQAALPFGRSLRSISNNVPLDVRVVSQLTSRRANRA